MVLQSRKNPPNWILLQFTDDLAAADISPCSQSRILYQQYEDEYTTIYKKCYSYFLRPCLTYKAPNYIRRSPSVIGKPTAYPNRSGR